MAQTILLELWPNFTIYYILPLKNKKRKKKKPQKQTSLKSEQKARISDLVCQVPLLCNL